MTLMNSISGFSSQLRLTGLSGFDTETIVQELMKAERIPLNTLKQRRTLVQWKQEAYREVSSSLIGFKSKFFDIVNRSTYMLSESSIKLMKATSSNSEYVTATAAYGANAGAYNIKVKQLATASYSASTGKVSGAIEGTVDETELANIAGKKLKVTLDGVVKEIELKEYTEAYNEDNLAERLQEALDSAFGKIGDESKFIVAYDKDSNILSIDTKSNSGVTKLTIDGTSEGIGALSELGIIPGASNRISLKRSLVSLNNTLANPFNFDAGGFVTFEINGKVFTADATDTLEKVFAKINNDEDANVIISYDEISDKITITSKQTGAGNNLSIKDISGNFLGALNLGDITAGNDAIVSINGQEIVRSTNNFTINGITYTLHKAHGESSEGDTITVEQNTDTVISNIKSFIEEYNKLIDMINGKVNEKYDRNYPPLTDEQKEEMKEKDIENWEKKAKTGLLRNDSILQQLTYTLRKAIYEPVKGTSLTLKDIGISSNSYQDYGKLHIDEDKLKNALLNNPDEVIKLLNGVSEAYPTYSRDMTTEQKKERYENTGVFQRMADIFEDYITTKRNADGRKGILIEKAGIENDLSNTENLLYEELEDYDERIADMIQKLIRKEENYYKKFSNLEKILNQMNQQSAWLLSQFGGN
ncbi:MAG: flagellar filament capping protein FliD [Clostridiaceae bacterium]|nr:flagellar filament capping protein FliD [Clostridiaceae bacterium]